MEKRKVKNQLSGLNLASATGAPTNQHTVRAGGCLVVVQWLEHWQLKLERPRSSSIASCSLCYPLQPRQDISMCNYSSHMIFNQSYVPGMRITWLHCVECSSNVNSSPFPAYPPPPAQCSPSQFPCLDRRGCVKMELLCDNRTHCDDGSDEHAEICGKLMWSTRLTLWSCDQRDWHCGHVISTWLTLWSCD